MSNVVRWLAPDLLAQPEPVLEQEDAFELTEPDPEHEPEPPLQLPTLEEIQAIQDSAEKEGFQHGHAEGYGQGQAEVRRLAAQIEGILDNFSRPLVRLENEVVGALGELAVRIAGALVGRAMKLTRHCWHSWSVRPSTRWVAAPARSKCDCTRMTSPPSPRC